MTDTQPPPEPEPDDDDDELDTVEGDSRIDTEDDTEDA